MKKKKGRNEPSGYEKERARGEVRKDLDLLVLNLGLKGPRVGLLFRAVLGMGIDLIFHKVVDHGLELIGILLVVKHTGKGKRGA